MYIHVYNVRAVIVTCKCLHVNGKVVMGRKGALIGEWCGVEFGVDRVGPACPDCGRERSAPGWKVQSIPRGIQYVSRGFGTLYPLYWIVAESWFSSPLFAWSVVSVCVVSFGVLSVWHVLVFGLLRRGLWARFHASGGRSCKGWRAQSTPRGVQCISSDASLFTIGNSSHVGSSTFRFRRTRRLVVVWSSELWDRGPGLQDGFGNVGWTVQSIPRGVQYVPRDVT